MSAVPELRIVYIAPFDLRLPAGHTSHVLGTVREMVRKGHHVTLLSAGCPEDLATLLRPVPVAMIPRPGLQAVSFGIASAAVVAREVLRHRPDVVYARYFKSVALPMASARLGRVPVILEVNSDTANERRTNKRGNFAMWLEIAEERSVFGHAGAVVAVTEAIADSVDRGSRVSVVANGVDTAVFKPRDRAECARRHGLDVHRKRVVFTGAFQVWQGVLDLVAAMALVVGRRPDVDLLLVGDGPLRRRVERAVAAAELDANVVITGYVSERVAAELICACDVCVAPYNCDAVADSEMRKRDPGARMRGSPLKVFSYLASGVPVVASHFLEAGVYVAEAGAGIAVAPERPEELSAAILKLIEDPEAARAMGQRGRALAVQRHSWSAVVDSYLEIAAELAERRTTKR